MTSMETTRIYAGLIVIMMVFALTGCLNETVHESKQAAGMVSAEQLAARPALFGGDTRAWPTSRGGNNDGGFCAANLRVPLATEPAWEYTYSAAEFSAQPVQGLLHYDGRIVLTAFSPQLVVLDASNGSVLLNQDVYVHRNEDRNEGIERIYGHPQGLLLGQDNLGRYYVWDLLAPGLPRLWLGPEIRTRSGFVTEGSLMLSGWNDHLYGLDVLTGVECWQFPTISQPGGVVLSHSGIELWWTRDGRLYALDAAQGAQLWSITTTDTINRTIIDDELELAYVVYGGESLECRQLADGEVLWQYSWSDLIDVAERQQLFDAVLARIGNNSVNLTWDGVRIVLDDIALSSTGVVLSLSNGCVIALDHNGAELWCYAGQATNTHLVAFENAVLLGELYVRPEILLWERAVFCLEEPDWPVLQQVRQQQATAGEDVDVPVAPDDSAVAQDSGVILQRPVQEQQELFFRFVALDLATGHELSAFEPELFPSTPLLPAQENIVFAESQHGRAYIGARNRDNRFRVLAYPWIDREGE